MAAPQNTLKRALTGGEMQRGIWLNLGSISVAEMAGDSGFDWCLIDGEHGPWDPVLIRNQLIALTGTGAAPVVRVPTADEWVIKQALDLGAQSVMIPMIHSAEDAAKAVAACRYPPEGSRGVGAMVARAGAYGAISDYTDTANDEICILVQVESRAGLDAIEAIADVDGVDLIFVGPADLAADMGHRSNPGHPELRQAVEEAIDRIRSAGKPAGIIVGNQEDAQHYAGLGVTFLGLGSEAMMLSAAMRALAAMDVAT